MLQDLKRLQRLWFLIFVLAVILLIVDIALSSKWDSSGEYSLMPLPLVPDLLTICIFGYGLWGKTNPLLLASASPTAKPWKRRLRLFGNLLLIALWMMNAIIGYASRNSTRKVIASLATLQIVLVAVDLIACRRIGRLQRALLKQEQRQQEELAQKKRKGLENHSSIELTTHDRSIKDEERDSDDDMAPTVEIIRPEEVDPEVVVYGQQVMFDMHQRQLQREYQLYLEQQRLSGSGGEDHAGIEIPEGETESGVGKPDENGGSQEGKLEDILRESSYKIEEPVESLSTGPSSRTQLQMASAPPNSNNVLSTTRSPESDLNIIKQNPQQHTLDDSDPSTAQSLENNHTIIERAPKQQAPNY